MLRKFTQVIKLYDTVSDLFKLVAVTVIFDDLPRVHGLTTGGVRIVRPISHACRVSYAKLKYGQSDHRLVGVAAR